MSYLCLDHDEFKKKFDDAEFDLVNNCIMYKGIESKDRLCNFYFVDPSTFIRPSKSVNTNGNSYNLLLNNLEGWKDFPQRQYSIIATTNVTTAAGFAKKNETNGKTFVVIPTRDSLIAIAPKPDIWYSFSYALEQLQINHSGSSLKYLNSYLTELFRSTAQNVQFDTTWERFLEFLNVMTSRKYLKPKYISKESKRLLKVLIDKKTFLMDFMNKTFHPGPNGFQTRIYNTILSCSEFPNNEIWTTSRCFLIELETYLKIISPNP